MKIDVRALAVSLGLLWGGGILLTALASMLWPGYGRSFLELAASIYPGYTAAPSAGQALLGTVYGLIDGAIGGLVLGWLYNAIAALPRREA